MEYLLDSCKNHFEKFKRDVQVERVFLLGAGFSRDFGFTTADTLINGVMGFYEGDSRVNVRNYINNVYDFPWHSWHLHRLQDFFAVTNIDRNKLDLYSFMRITSEPEYAEIRHHFFCLMTEYFFGFLLENQVAKEEYIGFIRSLNSTDSIVTLNWDVIPEALLQTQEIPFTRHDWTSEKLMIIKLHGSLDLLQQPSDSMLEDQREIPQRFELLTSKLWRAVTARGYWPRPRALIKQLLPWEKYDKHGLFIVPPFEISGYKSDYISYNWARAQHLLNECKRIIAIGYSFPDEDHKVQQLLTNALGESKKILELWNPDRSVRKKVKELFKGVEVIGDDIIFSETPYMKAA